MSSHKKRRELNRSTAEHNGARIRAELAQGIVNFENLMEHAMGVRIKELERERNTLLADNERLRDALVYEENLRLGNEQIDLADKVRDACIQACECEKLEENECEADRAYNLAIKHCATAIRAMKERP